MTKGFVFSLAVLLLLGGLNTQASSLMIANFSKVTQSIYRGGRPTVADLSNLKSQYQIKTILDLEDQPSPMATEKAEAKKLGINWIAENMSAQSAPSDAELAQINSILTDPNNFPIFVHCLHGQDRTGLIIGLYEVVNAGMTPAAAYQEMLNLGFHPKYVALDNTFRQKTGYNGP